MAASTSWKDFGRSAETGSPESRSRAQSKADLGILFVHGIGEHEHGTTLERMGTRFVEHLDVLGQVRTIRRSKDGDAILVDHSWAGSYRLQEANWDVELEPPTFRETLVWLVLVTPWVLQREVMFWKLRSSAGAGFAGSVGSVWGVFTSYRGVLGLLASFLLGPIVQLVLLILALLRWIPGVGRLIVKILQLVLGDSYLFVESPEATRHMRSTVTRELEQLSASCERSMVVAHSQGAAVTVEALSTTAPPPNFGRLVTLGAGISKLSAMREIAGRTSFLTVWLVLRLALLFVMLVSLDASQGSVHEWLAAASYLLVGIGPMVGTWTGRKACASAVRRARGLGHSWTWIDLWSRHDLVPDGALTVPPEVVGTGVVTVEVRNVTSWWPSWVTDHTTYIENTRQVIPILAASAEQLAAGTGRHPLVPIASALTHGAEVGLSQKGVVEGLQWTLDSTAPALQRLAAPADVLATLDAAASELVPIEPARPVEPLPTHVWRTPVLIAANVASLLAATLVLSALLRADGLYARIVVLTGVGAVAAGVMLATLLTTTFYADRVTRSPVLRRSGRVFSLLSLAIVLAGGFVVWNSLVPLERLQPGDCFAFWGELDDSALDPNFVRLPCDHAHQGEVIALLEPPADLDEVDDGINQLYERCLVAMAELGVDAGQRLADVIFIHEGAQLDDGTPARLLDKEAVCYLLSDVPIVGDLLVP
jgi:hypothetical protein